MLARYNKVNFKPNCGDILRQEIPNLHDNYTALLYCMIEYYCRALAADICHLAIIYIFDLQHQDHNVV